MAGKRQKHPDLLQNKRGGRYRPLLALPELTAEQVAARNAAIEKMMRGLDRAAEEDEEALERFSGAGASGKPGEAAAVPWKRTYRKKGERGRSEAKAQIAARRPRDAKGHFLPRERG